MWLVQGDPNKGDAQEKEAELRESNVNDLYFFRSMTNDQAFQVRVTIAESVPEPSTFVLFGIGCAVLVSRYTICRRRKSNCQTSGSEAVQVVGHPTFIP